MKRRHLILGILFWLAAAGTMWTALRSELQAQSSSVASLSRQVTRWLSGQKQTLTAVSDEYLSVAPGDPIFLRSDDGTFRQVGLAVNLDGQYVRTPRLAREFEVVIYDDALESFSDGLRLDYHTTPMALDWVVRTMIPRERQQEIARLITSEWLLHQQEITAELRPVIREGLRTAMKAVEAQLPEILKKHRDEFRKIGDRYETEILKAELIPLVKNQILPIIEEEAAPVAEDVGRALWKRVSLWSFTWRLLYDKSPLPRRDAVKAEFQRFIDEEALPELRSRSDQFIEVTEVIVKRTMENQQVKDALKKNLKRVIEDRELHKVIKLVIREAVVENEALRAELEAHLRDQETRTAMKMAGDRLEPMVRTIGDMIFGTRETGITPEFSSILRAQILQKDRRWFVLVPASGKLRSEGQISAIRAAQPMVFPTDPGDHDQSPLTPVQN